MFNLRKDPTQRPKKGQRKEETKLNESLKNACDNQCVK